MPAEALDTEYENGVADILAYVAGDAAVVERNVKMQGFKSGKKRQIDVKVSGTVFGARGATMVVDCKRYAKPVDVNNVGMFVGLVEDVCADIGLLVTTVGISQAALRYAQKVRGIQLEILPLEELAAWSPRGTVHFDYAVPTDLYSDAIRAVRRAGFRVRPVDLAEREDVEGLGLSAFKHLGNQSPTGELQVAAREAIEAALRRIGAEDFISLGNGVVIGGGTPAHRHLDVTIDGESLNLKVLVSSEEDISAQLDVVHASVLRGTVSRDRLDVRRPDIWPISTPFPRWS